jgi:mannose-6-phosphate isomerase
LICGVNPGVSLEQLRQASQEGTAVEALLRRVPVKPGDAFYIPAGTVHAIGAGIVLYEIQQSSDITYRLYDWGRVDSNGRARELHLEESLSAIDLISRPQAAVPFRLADCGRGVRERLLDTPHFILDRIRECHGLIIAPDRRRFTVLTALRDSLLEWDQGCIALKKGRTALLPADGFSLRYSGDEALSAAPAAMR